MSQPGKGGGAVFMVLKQQAGPECHPDKGDGVGPELADLNTAHGPPKETDETEDLHSAAEIILHRHT